MNSKQAKEFIKALDALVAEKGIDKNYVIESMEAAMANAYKKNEGISNVKARVNPNTGEIKLYTYRTVIEKNPEDELSVKIITAKDSDAINEVKKQLQSQLNKYGKIFKVADIKLIRSGTSVQPDNVITLKILVPKELINTEFELYHIHDENGVETITKIDYTDVDEEGYITIQTETLSSFVFVYDQTSLVVPIVIFAILSAVLAVLLVLQLKKFKNRKKNSVLVSAVPVFYVFGELLSTIVLGIVFGLLVIANIVFLILNLKQKKQKESVKRVKVKADK